MLSSLHAFAQPAMPFGNGNNNYHYYNLLSNYDVPGSVLNA